MKECQIKTVKIKYDYYDSDISAHAIHVKLENIGSIRYEVQIYVRGLNDFGDVVAVDFLSSLPIPPGKSVLLSETAYLKEDIDKIKYVEVEIESYCKKNGDYAYFRRIPPTLFTLDGLRIDRIGDEAK